MRQRISDGGTSRAAWCAGSALLAAVLAGCQSYEPAPLEAAGAASALTDRAGEIPAVLAAAAGDGGQPAAPFTLDDGLSLPEAELVALLFNLELRVARLRAGVAKAAADNAGLWDDPVLAADVTRILQSVQNPWKLFTTVGFTLPVSGRLDYEKARAGAAHTTTLVQVLADEWNLRAELRRAWSDWSAAIERVAVLRDFLARFERIEAIVDRLEEAGELPRIEAQLFRIERVDREDALLRAEGDVATGELALLHLMGLAPTAPVALAPWLPAGDGASPDEPTVEELDRRNVELAVARAEYEVAERTLALEVREQFPDVMVGPGYGYEDGDDQFLLNVAVPLPILNANRQAIAVAQARRDELRGVYDATLERTLSHLAEARVRRAVAAARRDVLEHRLVPLAEAQHAAAERIAQLGEVDALVLLESLSRQQQARLDLIEARLAERLAEIRVQTLEGPPIAPVEPIAAPVEEVAP